jgi:hypothetical protein
MILTLNPFNQPTPPADPIGPETELSNLASDLYIDGQTELALETIEKALKIARTVPSLVNMSVILEGLGRFDEAMPYSVEAYNLSPKDKRTIGLYAEALLRQGDMVKGWPLYIESRNTRSQLKDFIPEWTNQDLEGKRLLVIEGEGYGDNIYFLRWLHTLRDMGAKIDFVCQPSVAPLIEHLGFKPLENWSGNVIGLRFENYDYHTSILTLPYKFGVTVENYRWPGPYISVSKLKEPSQTLRIGICSLAGEGMSMLKQRSMHASQLQLMLNSLDPKHQWVNLHHRYVLPDAVDHPLVETWLDTARAIATCDMVVSVDTCVAHLSAAMGVTTWVLLPGASAWHYLLHRPDHPLYPSMRMYRNYGRGLDNAIEAACDHLSRF